MPSLTSLVEKRLGRDFVIFHPSDFSPTSEVAFVRALKIALRSEAKLDLMHVESSLRAEKSVIGQISGRTRHFGALGCSP